MPDQQFANPRLAEIYDELDSDRGDLLLYMELIEKCNAKSVLDIGCGTGSLLSLLAGRGYNLTGVDPANASLDIAKRKHGAESISWIHGDSSLAPKESADVAVMTGNVAQVFIEDEAWFENLSNIHRAVKSDGRLIFESRDPNKRAWEKWNRKSTISETDIPGIGTVVSWTEVTEVSLPLVSFTSTYRFKRNGDVLKSDSTLCFRSKEDIERSLIETGFSSLDILDAPDRPGKEFVFVAKKEKD